MNTEKKRTIIIVLLIFVGMTLLQSFSILIKKTITDDEGVTYMIATGHQGEYNDNRPSNKWVHVSEWSKMWKLDDKFCFSTISKDLAKFDIHPPLFFWLLHIWVMIFGTTTMIGPFINILFYILILYLVYKAGMRIFKSFQFALASSVIWGISPAVFGYIREIRQYTLLSLCTVILLQIILSWIENKQKRSIPLLLSLTFVSLAGVLTHYYFGLFIAASFLVLFLVCEKEIRWKNIFFMMVAELFAAIVFIFLHPSFYLSFTRQQDQAQAFLISDFIFRLKSTAMTFTSFYFPEFLLKAGFILLSLGIILFAGIVIIKFLRKKPVLWNINTADKIVIIYFSFLSFVIIALYLGFISPEHAMQAKYLSMMHIFIIFITLFIISRINSKYHILALWIICIWQLSLGILFLRGEFVKYSRDEINQTIASLHSEKILLDSEARGVVPAVLWYFPDNMLVYASSQKELLKNDINWIDSIDARSIYISDLAYNNSLTQRNQILKSISLRDISVAASREIKFNSINTIFTFKQNPKE